MITKSIKMRVGAKLPASLYPEICDAAIHLYNKGPLARRKMKSPNQVLLEWFRSYYRWYDPLIIKKLSTDLRPDWSGEYAYGARAYPVINDREAGHDKRGFKVSPRAHIGYLVGYVASNLYRIWVP